MMQMIETLWGFGSPGTRLLDTLAVIVGGKKALLEQLQQHAALCFNESIKTGLVALAEQQAGHVRRLNAILREYRVWSRVPGKRVRDGTSNWERLTGDLELLVELTKAMYRAAAQWRPVDRLLADELAQIAREDDQATFEIRKLAARCDPHAWN
jgi:hypothetical protein